MFSYISSCPFPSAQFSLHPCSQAAPILVGSKGPCPEPGPSPSLEEADCTGQGWAAPSWGLAASLEFPLGPIAPEPASLCSRSARTHRDCSDTGVRQAEPKAGSTTYTLVMTPAS